MSELVLPHSIDASTEIVANEHQANYVAIRDLINGNLEGGGGSGNNFKANGVTARELADVLLLRGIPPQNMQEGVVGAGDYKVTPGAGLVLNFATGVAWITDDSGVLAAGALIPCAVSGSTVTIGTADATNPRIDQVIATMAGWNTGSVSVLPGTATAGATLDNRSGAAALPNNAIRLADVLVPAGFAGPFVQNTHIRDRRPWARGAFRRISRQANAGGTDDYTTTSTSAVAIDSTNLSVRLETSGNPVELFLNGFAANGTSGASVTFGWFMDGASQGIPEIFHSGGLAGEQNPVVDRLVVVPSAGSHLFQPFWLVSAGTGTLYARVSGVPAVVSMVVRELITQDAGNDGA